MMLSKKMRALAAALALTMAAGVLGGCGGDKKEETAAKKTANVPGRCQQRLCGRVSCERL